MWSWTVGLQTWTFLSACVRGQNKSRATVYSLFLQQLQQVFRTLGGLLKIIFLSIISAPHFRTRVITLSFLPSLHLLIDALSVSVACKWALGGAGGALLCALLFALLSADLSVQREGEGSIEWRRGSSALAFLPAPGPLRRLAVDRVQLLHILLPLQLLFCQAVTVCKNHNVGLGIAKNFTTVRVPGIKSKLFTCFGPAGCQTHPHHSPAPL